MPSYYHDSYSARRYDDDNRRSQRQSSSYSFKDSYVSPGYDDRYAGKSYSNASSSRRPDSRRDYRGFNDRSVDDSYINDYRSRNSDKYQGSQSRSSHRSYEDSYSYDKSDHNRKYKSDYTPDRKSDYKSDRKSDRSRDHFLGGLSLKDLAKTKEVQKYVTKWNDYFHTNEYHNGFYVGPGGKPTIASTVLPPLIRTLSNKFVDSVSKRW